MNFVDLRPIWKPSIVPTADWTLTHTRKYLSGQAFTLYAHGSCVLWLEPAELPVEVASGDSEL